MENPFSLSGKTVLVTGASSGIGRAISVACAKSGATLVLNGRNEERLQETFDMIGNQQNIKLVADVTDLDRTVELVKELPALDGVVLCAGVGQTTPVQNLKYEKTITAIASIIPNTIDTLIFIPIYRHKNTNNKLTCVK